MMFGEIVSDLIVEQVVFPLVRERAECQTAGSNMAHGCERADCYCYELACKIVRSIDDWNAPAPAEGIAV